MAQRTATEVAEMESDIALFRKECEALRTQLAMATQERDALKIEVAIMSARAQEELVRATQMETIMSQVSMGLVAGLQKMATAKQIARALGREEQERNLEVGQDGHSPIYRRPPDNAVRPPNDGWRRQSPPPEPEAPRRAPETERQRIERLASRPVERLIPRMGDDRIPQNEFRSDDDELRALGSLISSGGANAS